ncbi:unnamed protein product [Linum tenue]|uniref:Uncharacterized protein n=1 Tax=Linum tenue TaxID=586396 RepID=A0AAV0RU43_9ROSI|nr:unnamed protein product [Linum tenue]
MKKKKLSHSSPTGFITAFSTWSLEPTPISLRSSLSFSGHLAELERILVQAIREGQEPRTLQEISIAANVPQKEIGKYIKILGEALQLSQPLNSDSISVHMPRFCNLLQLNKYAQVIGFATSIPLRECGLMFGWLPFYIGWRRLLIVHQRHYVHLQRAVVVVDLIQHVSQPEILHFHPLQLRL